MNKLKIYLDNCCFNRPFDDQRFLSIALETDAKLVIQNLIKDNKIDLLWSFILDYENSANPDECIKEDIFRWRLISNYHINLDEIILAKSIDLIQTGLLKKDALHVACAAIAKADFFLTVDKGILKKASLIKDLKIVNPIEFISILEEKT